MTREAGGRITISLEECLPSDVVLLWQGDGVLSKDPSGLLSRTSRAKKLPSWHCLLWGVRWAPSMECSESGQSAPLRKPDLILLAAGRSPRPCCLRRLPAHAGSGKSSLHWGCEPGSILSAADACSHISPHFTDRETEAPWGYAHCPRPYNEWNCKSKDLNLHLHGSRAEELNSCTIPLGVSWPERKLFGSCFSWPEL